MKCNNCGHEQSVGKFCGKCGGALVANTPNDGEMPTAKTSPEREPILTQPLNDPQPAAASMPYQAPIDSSIHVDKVKNTSKLYWTYFLHHLKTPSSVLKNPEVNMVNAIITFAIFAIISALSVYNIIGYLMAPVSSGFGDVGALMPSFFKVLFYTAISVGMVFALSICSILIITKFFGPEISFKSLSAIFGTYMVPVTVLMLVAYFLLLIESRTFGSSLFILVISFSVYVLPLFLVTTLVNQRPRVTDSFYAFVGYIVLFTILLSIVMSIFIDSTISELLNELSDIFSYSNFY